MTLATLAAALRRLCRSAFGVLLVVAGFAWLAVTVRANGGIVPLSTAIGVSILILAGGWMIDREKTIELAKFVLGQVREWAAAIADALKGSGGPPPGASPAGGAA